MHTHTIPTHMGIYAHTHHLTYRYNRPTNQPTPTTTQHHAGFLSTRAQKKKKMHRRRDVQVVSGHYGLDHCLWFPASHGFCELTLPVVIEWLLKQSVSLFPFFFFIFCVKMGCSEYEGWCLNHPAWKAHLQVCPTMVSLLPFRHLHFFFSFFVFLN